MKFVKGAKVRIKKDREDCSYKGHVNASMRRYARNGVILQMTRLASDGESIYAARVRSSGKLSSSEYKYDADALELVEKPVLQSRTAVLEAMKILFPEVKYIAQNQNGSWYGYKSLPDYRVDDSKGRGKFVGGCDSIKIEVGVKYNGKWENSILPKAHVPTKFGLNDSYSATISRNGDVEVGCQTITAEKVEEFIKWYKNEKKHLG